MKLMYLVEPSEALITGCCHKDVTEYYEEGSQKIAWCPHCGIDEVCEEPERELYDPPELSVWDMTETEYGISADKYEGRFGL